MQDHRRYLSWAALLAIFVLLGPVVGGMTFWVGGGLLIGAVLGFKDFGNLASGALAISIGLAPLGMIQALITGIIAGLISRRVKSAPKWILWTTLTGTLVSAFSLLTVLAAYVFSAQYGAASGVFIAFTGMSVVGAVSSAACAALSVKLRPLAAAGK